jgi:hypothetical protein
VSQGRRWGWLVKKTRGRKSRATVPLKAPCSKEVNISHIDTISSWDTLFYSELAFVKREYELNNCISGMVSLYSIQQPRPEASRNKTLASGTGGKSCEKTGLVKR